MPIDLNEVRRNLGIDSTQDLPWLPDFIDGDPIPEQEWVIPDRIPNQQVALYSGQGAAGKSITALHWCAAHSIGREWLDCQPEPGPAFFIDAEDGADVIHRRLDAIRIHYNTTFDEMYQGGLKLMSLLERNALLATASRDGPLVPTPLYQQMLEAADRWKPKLIAIASLANVYGGVEYDRSQVQQFVAMIRRIAITANGAVVLISHPSVLGISSDSGISGSTQWHNAVRARLYLKGIKNGDDELADNDLRVLEFRKNNYGPVSSAVVLRWRDGLFLPERGPNSIDKLARESRADEVFTTLTRRFNENGRHVTEASNTAQYAPKVFAQEPEAQEAKLTKADLEKAMARLFRSNKIRLDENGPPSKRRNFIALM